MGTRAADYTEYIDITTGTVRRKRTGMLLRDSEDIFIVDPNITIPKNKQTNFLSKIQNDLTINSEKPYYFAKTSLQPISKTSTEQLEYFTNAENFSLSPTNTLAPITFLKSKAKLPEDKQLTVKNNDSLTDEAIITVESSEIVVITEKDIDQSSQILKPKSDLKQGQKPPGAKAEIAIEAPFERIENEIVEFNKKDLLRNQVKQRHEEQKEKQKLFEELARVEEQRKSLELEELARVEEQRKSLELEELAQVEEQRKSLELEELARQEERRKKLELEELAQVEERRKSLEEERRDREAEKHRLELERLAKEEEARTKQKKLKEYYDKHNAEVLARTERQKQEEERQKQERLQKFKEYHEQQVRKILFQLERQKKLEKQRLEREELEKLKAKSLLDELKEGIVLLELAQKQAAKKLLPAGVFFKEHPLVREAKNQLGLQKGALEKGVMPELGKLEELIRGITRTAEVITLETERLSQAEAERVKFKFAHKIKEPLKVEKTFFQKLKEKFSGCFSANDIEPKPKTIEMVSVLHSKAQDNEIPVDPIGVDAPIIDREEL